MEKSNQTRIKKGKSCVRAIFFTPRGGLRDGWVYVALIVGPFALALAFVLGICLIIKNILGG